MEDAFRMLTGGVQFSRENLMSSSKLTEQKNDHSERRRASASSGIAHQSNGKTSNANSAKLSRERANAARNRMGIKVQATDVLDDLADPLTDFNSILVLESTRMRVPQCLPSALESIGFSDPTPVQSQCIPCMLDGSEVLAVAPTGSGKTLAYVVPALLEVMNTKRRLFNSKKSVEPAALHQPKCLILAPTVELASQIGSVCSALLKELRVQNCEMAASIRIKVLSSKAMASGLHSSGGRGADLLIATPLSLLHLMELANVPPSSDVRVEKKRKIEHKDKVESLNASVDKTFSLAYVKILILDEADRLFDSEQFLEQIDNIIAKCGAKLKKILRKVHLFSATMPTHIENMSKSIQRDPIRIAVQAGGYGGMAAVENIAQHIDQRFVFAGAGGDAAERAKRIALENLLHDGTLKAPILVFVESKTRAANLAQVLRKQGLAVDSIHGDRSLTKREAALKAFRSGSVWMLIATDLIARGMDFPAVKTVVNYDIPSTAVSYVHRIGRTGRAGRSGTAITLFCEDERFLLKAVASVAAAGGVNVPEWMLQLKAADRNEKKKLIKNPPSSKNSIAKI